MSEKNLTNSSPPRQKKAPVSLVSYTWVIFFRFSFPRPVEQTNAFSESRSIKSKAVHGTDR